MKRILAMVFLAVLTVGLPGSCTKSYDERLDKIDSDVFGLKEAVGQYESLSGDITSVIEALRAEIGTRPASEQQSVWNCIAALQNQKGTFDAAIAALNALVGEKTVSGQINEAVAKLTSKYQLESLSADIQAIKDKLTEKTGISALSDKVAQLQKNADIVTDILSEIDDYGRMIQSVRINPASADGSVKSYGGILSFTFTVTPAEAISGVKNLAKCLKLYANEVELKTKAGVFAEIPVTKAEITDPEKGEVSIVADIADYLPAEKTGALSVALNVKAGVSNYTTDFATVFNIDCLRGLFTVNDEGKQVHFSKGNLKYTTATKTWGFFEKQYDCDPGINRKASEEYVSLFAWGYNGSITGKNYNDYVTGYMEGENFGYNEDWGSQVEPSGVWRTLAIDEWEYVISRTGNSFAYCKCDKGTGTTSRDILFGLLLFPDGWSGWPASCGDAPIYNQQTLSRCGERIYSKGQIEKLEEYGVVFLPQAGYCPNSEDVVTDNDGFLYGCYRSSTAAAPEGLREKGYHISFTNYFGFTLPASEMRSYGYSVRLVTDVK